MKNFIFKLNYWRDRNFLSIIVSIAALFGLIFGFSMASIASAILFIDDHFHISYLMNGTIVSSILAGALIGSIFAGYLADRYGRRNLLIIGSLFFIISNIGIYFTPELWLLVICRLIIGCVIGVWSFVVPLYVMEILPVRYSNKVIILNQLLVTIGMAISYIIGYFFAHIRNWQLMLSIVAIPTILLFLLLLIVPESPRWLLAQGKEGNAWRILRRIRHSFEVDVELDELKNSINDVRRDWHVLLKKWLFPAVVIVGGLAVFRQLTGINLFFYYAPTIFEMAGFKIESTAILITAILGVFNVLCSILALPLLRKYGRRSLLLFGMSGIVVSWLFLGLAFWLGGNPNILRWLTFSGFLLYIFSFAISFGLVVFVVLYEIFPMRIRGVATSAVISLTWLCNIFVTFSFVPLVGWLSDDAVFLVYFIVCLLGWLFVYFVVPETKGVSSERIETNLRLGKKGKALVE